MKERITINYNGGNILGDEQVKTLQSLKPLTKAFEQQLALHGSKRWQLDQVFPTGIVIDLDYKRVTLIMNNYCVGETTDYGDYISARKIETGYQIGDDIVQEDRIKSTIKEQVGRIIKSG